MSLWRLHVDVADQPGQLGALAAAVGGCGANIESLHVVGEPAEDGSVTDELLVKVPPRLAVPALVESVEAAGFRCGVVVQADAQALADPVTTALALAHCVAADPGSAPRAVAALLRAELAGPGAPASAYQVEVGAGAGRVRLGRSWPFTATEISRAAALLELAGTSDGHRPPPPRATVQLTDGCEIVLRAATAADVPLIAALHARCSPQTRSHRSLPTRPGLPPAVLHQLVGGERTTGLLALTTDGGAAIGLANLSVTAADAGEIALLVEDAWQGRGVGTALVRRVVELARAQGLTELVAVSHADNHALTRVLRRAGLRPRGRLLEGALHVQAKLPADELATTPPAPAAAATRDSLRPSPV
ncbi:MAG TPA: GNAT family N-acetyltransferase [Pseudonocardiaceae bacterium]|nr:GNAT family N-acetyltransferase [Pseudonocardiaceae bacterium]